MSSRVGILSCGTQQSYCRLLEYSAPCPRSDTQFRNGFNVRCLHHEKLTTSRRHEDREKTTPTALEPAMPFSIEQYKRKLQVRAAQAGKRGSKTALGGAEFVFHGMQKQYLDFCVEKTMNPDHKLLAALKTRSFVLQLDAFADEELSMHMEFLQKVAGLHQIVLSLGVSTVQRDIKKKFERLGISKAPAFKKEAAASILRASCTACTKSPKLVRLQLRGIQIAESIAPLLAQALAKCDNLEVVNLCGTSLGDKGLEAIAIPLAKRPRLLYMNLSQCKLTQRSKEDLAKIIAVHGTLRDEGAWSSSLRGATPVGRTTRPSLLVDLSHNALGDTTVEVLCSALYHDKWILGLNLNCNSLTAKALGQLRDGLLHSNFTLAVLKAEKTTEATGQNEASAIHTALSDADYESFVHSIDAIVAKRVRYLHQFISESSERRLFLCNLLLEWHADQDLVFQLCNEAHLEKKSMSVSPSVADNQDELDDPTPSPQALQPVDLGHIQTIKFLVDRLSALEAEQRKTSDYVARLEEENRQLREKVKWKSQQERAAPALEENVIAQLEHSITVLTKQIESLEMEKGIQ